MAIIINTILEAKRDMGGCDRCKNFILKGELYLKGILKEAEMLQPKSVRYCLHCGIKEIDILDSLRINNQLNKKL